MRIQEMFLVGLTSGQVGVHCERWQCDWVRVLPPNSTMLDLERVAKTHVHPLRKEAA